YQEMYGGGWDFIKQNSPRRCDHARRLNAKIERRQMIGCNWNEWVAAEDAQPRCARPRVHQTVGVVSAPSVEQMLRHVFSQLLESYDINAPVLPYDLRCLV